jgi:hypothetical protein
MANTWGENLWGLGDWGLQNDSLALATGEVSSISVNSIDYAGEPGGWGQFTWGFNEWGDLLNPNVDITGLQLNTSVGNEEAFTDITVNVSTDLLNIYVSSPFIIIGVLIEPNSFLLNTTVNSVFAGESVVIEVTTPGSPTKWGEDHWGYADWGQITGLIAQESEEEVGIETNVALAATELATVTLDPNYEVLIGILEEPTGVLITSNVNSVFAGELVISNVTGITINSSSGTLDINADANVTINNNLLNIIDGEDDIIIGDANVTPNTNLLNVVVGNVNHIIDVVVEVNTPGSPSVWSEYAWGQQAWGQIIGLEIEQGGEEVIVPSIDVEVIGNQLNTTVGALSTTADANLTLDTNLLSISIGDEDAIPNTIVTLSTNLLNVSTGFAYAFSEVIERVTGVSATISTGRLYVSAWAVVDIGVTNAWTVVDIAA